MKKTTVLTNKCTVHIAFFHFIFFVNTVDNTGDKHNFGT